MFRGLSFVDEDEPEGESWEPLARYAAPFVARFWRDDPYNRVYERDYHELGLLVTCALESENDGPEWRRWERADAIACRVPERTRWVA